MKRETKIWTIILAVAGIWILSRVLTGAMPEPVSRKVIGTWIGAFFTLALFSFLYRDNPFYKFAEHAFVGVSAAYWMVVGFWTTIIPNLLGKLAPDFTRSHYVPGISPDARTEWLYLVPLILGILLLWRLSPKGGWIGRWPLAFILGTTAGIRLIGFLEADFLLQIRQSIKPFLAYGDGGVFELGAAFSSVVTVVATLCALTYFFFSVEQKGVVGGVARVGIWVLMITFGAGFGYTVMGRVALLVGRFQFLLDDWLHLLAK
ncbi:MAG: hypothetical protein O7H41_19070 [Planctomycetota bacterium]|nr:hypothetical protein [Planctomycetota bacterium]